MAPLLAQAARRDRTFERLYQRHVKDVYRYAYAVLQNRADAEDVTQTTFLNAYRAFERGERPDKPHNWLIAIAHNVCRQRFRQSQRRPNEVALHQETVEQLVGDDETPSAEDIRRALSYLPFNQRAALVMRELEGRSYAEIAEVLELSVGAVETLIFRARQALREQLEGSLTCREAELAISKQLDGRLSRAEKGPLRAHLRECPECATFARSQRAQRSALKALGSVPLPVSLASFFGGGGGGTVGAAAVATKAAAVVAAAAVAGSASYETVRQVKHHSPPRARVAQRPAVHAVPGAVASSAAAVSTNVVLPARVRGQGAPATRGRGNGQRSEDSFGRGKRSGEGRAEVEAVAAETEAFEENRGRSEERNRGNGRAEGQERKNSVVVATVASEQAADAASKNRRRRRATEHQTGGAKKGKAKKAAAKDVKPNGPKNGGLSKKDEGNQDEAQRDQTKQDQGTQKDQTTTAPPVDAAQTSSSSDSTEGQGKGNGRQSAGDGGLNG